MDAALSREDGHKSRLGLNGPPQRPYAISEWHDTDAVYEKLRTLIKQPMRLVRRDYMAEVLRYFETKCPRSKALIEEAKKYIPSGVQHNLAFNSPFPLAVEKAEGAYLW